MRIKKMLEVDLQLFNGAAAGGAAAGGGEGAGQAAEGALSKAETNSGSGSSRRSKSGAFDNVVFGKQEDAPQTETATDPVAGDTAEGNGKEKTGDIETRRKAFRDMVNGEYKDVYTEETQQIINRRFKDTKVLEESLKSQKPIMDMLMQRYQIADGDPAKLQAAIEEDNSYWQEAAEAQGLTVEQYKANLKLQAENAELKAAEERRMGQLAAQQQFAKWTQDAEGVKAMYPSFELTTELQNGHFRDLLKKGVSMQQAFELIHMEEIKNATAKSAAQTASEQMAANIKARAARPSENAASSKSAVIVKNDVHNLTKADRAEAARQAMRGKKIQW